MGKTPSGGGGAGDRAGIDLVTNSPPQQATYPAPLPNTQWWASEMTGAAPVKRKVAMLMHRPVSR